MTTARRQARAETAPLVADGMPPAELYDPAAAVWHDRELYRAFIAAHGLGQRLPVAERIGVGASPGNRRNEASAAWGEQNGVVTEPGHADWHRLRQMGLIG